MLALEGFFSVCIPILTISSLLIIGREGNSREKQLIF